MTQDTLSGAAGLLVTHMAVVVVVVVAVTADTVLRCTPTIIGAEVVVAVVVGIAVRFQIFAVLPEFLLLRTFV